MEAKAPLLAGAGLVDSAAPHSASDIKAQYEAFQLTCEEEGRKKHRQIFGVGLWIFAIAIAWSVFLSMEGWAFGFGHAVILLSQYVMGVLFLAGVFVLSTVPPAVFDLDDFFGFPDKKAKSAGT
jgi:hypothetical protein